MPGLSVILVNYKRAADTIDCIHSLLRSSYTDIEIVVIDNGSADGSSKKIRHAFPSVHLIENPTNVGFAEGNNIGIRDALSRGCKFILLLNNDTVIEPTAIEHLLATFRNHPDAGIIGAKIYYHDRPNILWYAGGFFNPHSTFGGHYGIGEIDHGQFDQERTCTLVTGCCLLFRRELADRIGILDSDYFAYLEDADFCTRARRNGYSLYYQPKAVIYHKVSSTSAWDSPTYIYFNLRNKILFLRKNTTFFQWLPHLPRLLYYYLRQLIRLSLKWRSAVKTRAAWYGIVDGLGNNVGVLGKGRMETLI